MSRRVAVAVLGTSLLIAVPPSQAADPPPPSPLLPKAACDTRVTDPTSDGVPSLTVVQVNPVPNVADPRGNVPGLDLTAITLRVTETRVYAFMNVQDIPDAFRQTDSAYAYVMWFTRNGKVARFDQVYANVNLAAQGLAPTGGFSTASVGTTTAGGEALAGVGGAVDKAKNVAYVYADRASLEAKTGGPIAPGDEVSAIGGRTELWEGDGQSQPGITRRPADLTDKTGAAATWQVGDDRCFPQSVLTVTDVTAQYADPATVTATLKDEAGAPLVDRTLSFSVPGGARTATTDAAGVAKVVLASAPAAGTYPVKVTFAGNEFTGSGEGTGTMTVRAETVRMSKLAVARAGTGRVVTVTLTEDDPRAFAKQAVAWYVNGKKVATIATDSKGRSVFKGAKPGQKVQARYAGASGRYSPVVSNTVAV